MNVSSSIICPVFNSSVLFSMEANQSIGFCLHFIICNSGILCIPPPYHLLFLGSIISQVFPKSFLDLPYSASLMLHFPQYLMRCPLWMSTGLYTLSCWLVWLSAFLSSIFWYLHHLSPIFQFLLSHLVGFWFNYFFIPPAIWYNSDL